MNAPEKSPFTTRIAFIRDMIECSLDCGDASEAAHWQARLEAVMAQGEVAFNSENVAKKAPKAKAEVVKQSSEFGYAAAGIKHNKKAARRSKKFGLD